jgi:hemerythrin superfamily protein
MADDVVHLITRDHRALEALFEQLRSDKGSREEVLEQVAAMLVAHSRAEEEEVYPSLARAEPAMEREVHHGKEEHEQAERLLHELEATAPASAEFDVLLEEFVATIMHHVEEEEDELLPTLEEAVTPEELEELGRRFAERRSAELADAGVTIEIRDVVEDELDDEPAGAAGSADTSIDLTKAELYDKAKEQGGEGRSTMDKEELARAVDEG